MQKFMSVDESSDIRSAYHIACSVIGKTIAMFAIGIILLVVGCGFLYASHSYGDSAIAYVFASPGLICLLPIIVFLILLPFACIYAILNIPVILDQMIMMRKEQDYVNKQHHLALQEITNILKSIDNNQSVVGNYANEQLCAISNVLTQPDAIV